MPKRSSQPPRRQKAVAPLDRREQARLLRGLLELRGVRQLDLAEELGIHNALLNHVIRRRRNSARIETKIAEWLDLPDLSAETLTRFALDHDLLPYVRWETSKRR